jgi:DNA-directed RNA polymerase subunit RPC12/RpoP
MAWRMTTHTSLADMGRESKAKAGTARVSLYSFLGAVAVAMVVIAIWWSVQPSAEHVAMQRRTTDVAAEWTCAKGHVFERAGSVARVRCPECGAPSDMQVTYECPQHGDKPARIRLSVVDGREVLSKVSFRRRVWTNVGVAVRCPDCGKAMMPKKREPFARTTDETSGRG